MTHECCNDWIEKGKTLDSMAVLAHIHGQRYPDFRFNYCPWCGSEITHTETPNKPK